MVTLLCSNIRTNKLFASIYFKINHKNVCIKKLTTCAISAGHLASYYYLDDSCEGFPTQKFCSDPATY